jgi:hypothetical protein
MLQRYIIYLEQKNNTYYYGNISPFFCIIYYFSNKRYVIFVIILHKTINLIFISTKKNIQQNPSLQHKSIKFISLSLHHDIYMHIKPKPTFISPV